MREYPKEFKLESVRHYLENGKNRKKTSRDLKIPDTTLRGWIKKFMNEVIDKGNEKPKKKDYEKELQEKDKCIERLEEEVLILKKSIGIFTRDRLQK
jgi:transposase